MSVLSDKEIFAAIEKSIFSIDPLIMNNVQPGSIDLTLYHEIEVFSPNGVFDPQATEKSALEKMIRKIDISKEPFQLEPGAFITGYSAEKIKLSTFVGARIYNRISLAKCGIDASVSSFANPGFEGRKVIVIRNFGQHAVLLHAGMRICQLELHFLSSQAVRSYQSRHDLEALRQTAEATLQGRQFTYTADYKDKPLSEVMQQCIDEVVRGK